MSARPSRTIESKPSSFAGIAAAVVTIVVCAEAMPATSPRGHAGDAAKWFPGHYMLLGWRTKRENWKEIAGNPYFVGGQRVYLWRDLEPVKGKYDFTKIEKDLAYLRARGKKLVIEAWDTYFFGEKYAVPDYLLKDPVYKGGIVYRKGKRNGRGRGAVAKRWIPAVTDRYLALVAELGKRYDRDPSISAFIHTETAVSLGKGSEDYDSLVYQRQLERWVAASRQAFPKTPVILYGNWGMHKGIAGLKALGRYAVAHGVGWGGPDTCPGKNVWGYHVIREQAGRMAMGVAVQWHQYGGTWTADQIFDFARDDLKLNFMFWMDCERRKTGGLSFRKDVVPVVNRHRARINTELPENLRPAARRVSTR